MEVFAAPARRANPCRLKISPARSKKKAAYLNRWNEITAFPPPPSTATAAENRIKRVEPALSLKFAPPVTAVDANA